MSLEDDYVERDRYEALERTVEQIGRDWKEKCIEADTMRQHFANAEAEVKRLQKRDCNATIELTFNDGSNPFAREALRVVDVGVADNVYVVESLVVSQLRADVESLREQLRVMTQWAECCSMKLPAEVREDINWTALEKSREMLKAINAECSDPSGTVWDHNKKMVEAIKYALAISIRQHGDDYPYDDCWQKLRAAIGVKP
jgi:hypothetical protein